MSICFWYPDRFLGVVLDSDCPACVIKHQMITFYPSRRDITRAVDNIIFLSKYDYSVNTFTHQIGAEINCRGFSVKMEYIPKGRYKVYFTMRVQFCPSRYEELFLDAGLQKNRDGWEQNSLINFTIRFSNHDLSERSADSDPVGFLHKDDLIFDQAVHHSRGPWKFVPVRTSPFNDTELIVDIYKPIFI